MDTIDFKEITEKMIPLLTTVSEMSMHRFLDSVIFKQQVEYKADSSPVTETDKMIEYYLREALIRDYPQFGIIGEEYGQITNTTERYIWIIDPIDGTQAFIHGTPLFTILVALFDTEIMEPVVGLIAIPSLKKILYASKGNGAWLDRHRLQQTPKQIQNTNIPPLYLSYDWAKVYKKAPKFLCNIFAQNIITRTWADGFGYYLLATNSADIIIDPDTHFWDVAAIYPILHEAGIFLSDWQGNPIHWENFLNQQESDIIACADKKYLQRVLDLF